MHLETLMKTKYISFLITDDELLGKYNEIWEKVKNSIKKEFDSEPVYNEKDIKAKTNLIIPKSRPIFTIINYQKKVLNFFVYQ